MPYTTLSRVKSLAQIEYEHLKFDTDSEYDALVNQLIENAESVVDNFCQVDEGFFDAGGITITDEYHDFRTKYIQLNNGPVISITTLSINTAAYGSTPSWDLVDAENRYLNKKTGVVYLYNLTFHVTEQNVKVTYVAGFSATPNNVRYVTEQLCSNILHVVLQRKVSPIVRVDEWAVRMADPKIFTPELKQMLKKYRVIEASSG